MQVPNPINLDAQSGKASWGVIELTIQKMDANPIGRWKWTGGPFGGAPVGDWSWGKVGGNFVVVLDTQMGPPFAQLDENMTGKLLRTWRGAANQNIPPGIWFPQGLDGTGQCS